MSCVVDVFFYSLGCSGSTSGSTGSIGLAVGSFVGGAVVGMLICLIVLLVKHKKKKRNQVDNLPMTVRDPSGNDSHLENKKQTRNGRPQRDDNDFRGQLTSMCMPYSACL